MEKEVSVQEVIVSTMARRGKGVKHDPIRVIIQVFTKEGDLIAERDPMPSTFNNFDMMHFAIWCKVNKVEQVTVSTVDKWLDSIEKT